MKLKIVLLIYCMPLLLNAQTTHVDKYQNQNSSKGIEWVDAASWEEVKSLAKNENKYIFVDCYATWCQPCKMMDKEVYENEQVGEFLNSKFISVKIQMDKTKNDNDRVKSWYDDAFMITQQYNISSYPSYLFFSPDGSVVHKQTGYKKVKDFVQLSSDALDAQKQYYTLLNRYKQNSLDVLSVKFLARMCRSFGEKELAFEIANDYLCKAGGKALETPEDRTFLLEFKKADNAKRIASNYINGLANEEMYKKENIEFMANFMESTKDKVFRFFYEYKSQVDSVVSKKDYVLKFLDYVIDKEEIGPYWGAAINEKGIGWNKISNSIKTKYGKDYAKRIVLNSKIFLFKYLAGKKEEYWKDYLRYSIEKIQKYQSDTSDFFQENGLNEVAWYTFLHSNDKQQLASAIRWMEALVNRHPHSAAYLDTYANLLYKFGRKQDAIALEEKAYDKSKHESFKETLNKMKKGEPTWQ